MAAPRSIFRRRWIWPVTAAAIVLAIGGGIFWWLRGTTIWTDGQAVLVAEKDAHLRDVVWSQPKPVDSPLQAGEQQEYEPAFSPDGDEFYFVRGKPGGGAHIFVSYRRDNRWTAPTSLAGVNSSYDDLGPRVSADGNLLYFYSNRPGGFGGYDIWAARRTPRGWGKPFNLGPAINSEFNEYSPDPTPDGKHLIFSTNRKAASRQQIQAWRGTIRENATADYDLWIAELDENPRSAQGQAEASRGRPVFPFSFFFFPSSASRFNFKPAKEIPGINTEWTEGASCMSPAGDFLYFASNRPGGYGNFDIYRARRHDDWTFADPENLGPTINTAANETDPALLMNGFRLCFSSDRNSPQGIYALLSSDSREVYAQRSRMPLPRMGWSAWSLLVSAIVIVPLLLLLRGFDSRRLTLLQRCLVLSLLFHAALTFFLSFVAVTHGIAQQVRRYGGGGIVQVAAGKDLGIGLAIRNQISGDLPGETLPEMPSAPALRPTKALEFAGRAAAVAVGGNVPPVSSAAPRSRAIEPLPNPALHPFTIASDVPRIPVESQASDAIDVQLGTPGPIKPIATRAMPIAAAPTMSRPTASIAHGQPILAAVTGGVPASLVVPASAAGVVAPDSIGGPRIFAASISAPAAAPAAGVNSIGEAMIDVDAPVFTRPKSVAAGDEPTMGVGAGRAPTLRKESSDSGTRVRVDAPDPPPISPVSPSGDNVSAPDALAGANRASAFAIRQNSRAERAAIRDVNPDDGLSMEVDVPSVRHPPAAGRVAAGESDVQGGQVAAAAPPSIKQETTQVRAVVGSIGNEMPSANNAPGPGDAIASAANPDPPRSIVPMAPAPAPLALADSAPPPIDGLLGPTGQLPPATPFPRSEEQRKPLIEKLGGTPESEAAVNRGLAFLARIQESDGRWGWVMDDVPRDRRPRGPHDMACTGLAVLAFLAHDHTPDRAGPYRQAVTDALNYLIDNQGEDGDLRGPAHLRGGQSSQANMYDHAIATLALSEAGLMTQDRRCIAAAIKGARFIEIAQNAQIGGWRYWPNQDSDSSVFGWQIMALRAAEQLGYELPRENRQLILRYIAAASRGQHAALASYQIGGPPTPPMTAQMLYSRLLMGQKLTTEQINEGSRFLAQNPPDIDNPDVYYWYYAALSIIRIHPELWRQWNAITRDSLIAIQQRGGRADGSWGTHIRWADRGGKVFTTSLAILTLEVYYRYAPPRPSVQNDRGQQ